MDEKRSYAAPASVFGLLLLPMLYVGSYLALLKPTAPFLEPEKGNFILRVAEYRFGGEASKVFFRPLLEVDWRIRPNYWSRLSLKGELWLPQSERSVDSLP